MILKRSRFFRLLFLYSEVILERRDGNSELESVVKPICEALSLDLVESSTRRSGGVLDFTLIIHKKGGVSTDDCALLHRSLFLKLQTTFQKEIGLEISSPGLDRVLKYEDEFSIFIDQPVRWLEKGDADYQSGYIAGVEEKVVLFRTETDLKRVSVDNILKAKLNG